MKTIKKYLLWYYMSSKRLLHKLSFWLLICTIPCTMPLLNNALSEDGGVLEIVLCSEDNSNTSVEIMNSLMESNSVINFTTVNNPENAVKAVETFKADAAWIFEDNIDEKTEKYIAKDSSKPIVHIIEREDTVPLQLSKELLFGALYNDISYEIYKNHIYTEIVTPREFPENLIQSYFDSTSRHGNIVETVRLNSTVNERADNFLTAPMRGIYSLIIVLCGLAAALFFLKDQSEGKYDWLPPYKRPMPAFALCLSATSISALAVLVALTFSGLAYSIPREILSMLLYVIASTLFCMAICILFRSPAKLGAAIPGFIIAMLALSPIFFNLKELRILRLMIPSYYYLQATYNNKYLLYMLFYCLALGIIVYLLNFLINKRIRK